MYCRVCSNGYVLKDLPLILAIFWSLTIRFLYGDFVNLQKWRNWCHNKKITQISYVWLVFIENGNNRYSQFIQLICKINKRLYGRTVKLMKIDTLKIRLGRFCIEIWKILDAYVKFTNASQTNSTLQIRAYSSSESECHLSFEK